MLWTLDQCNLCVCNSGKSVSAKAVAASSGATAITVTGVEILSKGKQAGLYFRNLLDKMRKQKGHHIVIILDDADAIIKSRDSIRSNNDASSVHSCYYLLLEAMRESSLKLSFIVTTSLNGSSSVDSAFLDRYKIYMAPTLYWSVISRTRAEQTDRSLFF